MKQVDIMSDELLHAILRDLDRTCSWPQRRAEIIEELRARESRRNSPYEES